MRGHRQIGTHAKGCSERFDIGLIDFANAGERSSEHGAVVLVHSLLDEVWGLVLELLVG